MVNNMPIKGIILGDYKDAPYHPLKGIDDELKNIFGDIVDFEATENYEILNYEKLENYDLFLLYTDCFDRKQPKTYIQSIVKYVDHGGKLLVIHNGISLQNDEDFVELIGAKFTGHPEATELKIIIKTKEHPINKGIEEFSITEEPYRYDFKDKDNKLILLEYIHEDKSYPAAWCKSVGGGRLVYLMPGHNLISFKNENYRKIIYQSGKWLTNK